ncbi:sodium/panthothenate symporter [compost metagenome]
MHDILDALTIAYNLLVSGILVPLIGAIYWSRSTTPGALASMILGFATAGVMMYVDGIEANTPIYYSLGVSLVSFVLVSLATKKSELRYSAA